jgi:hypothetical protein
MRREKLMMRLSAAEMLALWKLRLHLLPARRDCEVEREDGIDIDALLKSQISQWYSRLLAEAPSTWLPIADLAADIVLTTAADGVVTARIPARCVRPVEFQLEGWSRPVSDFIAPDSAEALLQQSAFVRGGSCTPVAVLYEDEIRLYSVKAGTSAVLSRALCVVAPDDGYYEFSEEALGTIDKFAVDAAASFGY